jgi:hypothetical protein
MAEDSALNWYTSSYSADQGNCVQVAHDHNGLMIRDSKDEEGTVLQLSHREWAALTAAT